MIDTAKLIALAAAQGVVVTAKQADTIDRYAAMLVDWNERMNLTAITAPEEMLIKHFVDSLTLLPLLPQVPFSMVDVGTGAGFPGMVVAIMRQDAAVTLLDSLQKRLTFLDAVCGELGVSAKTVHIRAEDAGKDPHYREQYDVATARAVKRLPILCEYTLPLVKVGGMLAAMKGPEGEEELRDAEQAIRVLGGKTADVKKLVLTAPDGETMERTLITVGKISGTPREYPRPTNKIS